MTELVNRRSQAEVMSNVGETMQEMIDHYHMPGPVRRHMSPTKRLISLKNSALEHKMMFKEVGKGNQYHVKPGQSYMVDA